MSKFYGDMNKFYGSKIKKKENHYARFNKKY